MKKTISLLIVIVLLLCSILPTGFADEDIGAEAIETEASEGEVSGSEGSEGEGSEGEGSEGEGSEEEGSEGEDPGSEDSGGETSPTAAPTEAPILPVITKNPGAETVDAGNGCIFIAKADNYSSISWYFTKNGEVISVYDVNTLNSKFPGLKVSGDGTEILSLESVPKELNGWNVGCVFLNAAGRQGTSTCSITVNAPATPSPLPTVSPSPTVRPSASPSPLPTLAPTATVAPSSLISLSSPEPSLSPAPTAPSVRVERRGSPIGLILITALVLALLGGAAAVFILYRSGKLDLDALLPEKKEKPSKKNHFDDDDFGGGYKGRH